jgi:hypothetical protein
MGLEDGKLKDTPEFTSNGTGAAIAPISTVPEAASMDILRCAPMSLLQLYIPAEAAQATVAELGSIGLVQFRDVSL